MPCRRHSSDTVKTPVSNSFINTIGSATGQVSLNGIA
jgi:hypothetical protein